MENIVSVRQISKSYGSVQALKDISFDVKPGEIFGLIGPDGSGKTTLFRILTTLVLADKGEARVCGYEVMKEYKDIRRLGRLYAGTLFLIPRLVCRRKPHFLCHSFQYHHPG